MKKLQKSDLKYGDIYVAGKSITFINKEGTDKSIQYLTIHSPSFHKSGGFSYNNMREATPEEKHWLEACVEADKFIFYEEAMKTFEPEFVLPEKWCIRFGEYDQFLVLKEYFSKLKPYYKQFQHTGNHRAWSSDLTYDNIENFINYAEITFEQFKKYVLKEQLEEPKDKVLEEDIRPTGNKIIKVECSEGGVYKITDKITVFTKDSPNKGKKLTIKGFRWNNAKTNLCAITEVHTPNGIGLDKIELYVEPKVKVEVKQKLSLLEQAKLRYPIGTKFKGFNAATNEVSSTIGLSNGIFKFGNDVYYMSCIMAEQGFCYTPKSGWAEIIEDFILPEKKIRNKNISTKKN